MAPVHLESKLSQKLAAHFHICAFGIFSCNQVFQPLVRKVFCVLLSDGQVQLQRETERLRKKKFIILTGPRDRRHSMVRGIWSETPDWSVGSEGEV